MDPTRLPQWIRDLRSLGFLLVLGPLAAGACSRRATGPELSVVWSSDVLTVDPNEKFEFVTDTFSMNVYEPLVRFDRQMAIAPALAVRWEITGERSFRFDLRKGVRFHGGALLSASDVVYSFERVRNRPKSDLYRYLASVASVRAIDETTVEIVSERPASLLPVLSFVYILPRKSIERLGEEEFFRHPEGTGPYRLASREKGKSIRLEAWSRYWGTPPKIPIVTFWTVPNASGQWDEAARRAPAIVFDPTRPSWNAQRKTGRFHLMERPGLAVNFLQINLKGGRKNPLTDMRVRQAIRAAIDVDRLVSRVEGDGAFPAPQFVPPSVVGYDPSIQAPEFQPGVARDLLERAGHREGISLVLNCAPSGERLADELITQLGESGIRVTKRAVPADEFDARISRCEGDLHVAGWICSTGDAAELFEGNFWSRAPGRSDGEGRQCGYSAAELDETIEAIGRTIDPVARRDLLQSAMRKVVADLPWIPLMVMYDRYAATPGVSWEPRADGQLYLPDVRVGR